MPTDKELMQQALDALIAASGHVNNEVFVKVMMARDAINDALRRALEQPAMNPCAGRNCGSTNPNLHSAECFEDYEKATGTVQQEPVATVQDLDEVKRKHLVYERGFDWKNPLYTAPPQREWQNAALRIGEELSSVGPDGYYEMSAAEWLAWAIEQNPRGETSLPQREWQGLTDEEIHEVVSKKWWDWEDTFDIEGFSRAIEQALREKNNA